MAQSILQLKQYYHQNKKHMHKQLNVQFLQQTCIVLYCILLNAIVVLHCIDTQGITKKTKTEMTALASKGKNQEVKMNTI